MKEVVDSDGLVDIVQLLGAHIEKWRDSGDDTSISLIANSWAAREGVIGAAFGLIDPESNRFRLKRRMPELPDRPKIGAKGEDNLFPYQKESVESTHLHADAFRDAAQYSSFIHGIFQVQRRRQRLRRGQEGAIEVPEFFRKFTGADRRNRRIVVPYDQIRMTLRVWLAAWIAANTNEERLGTLLYQAFSPTSWEERANEFRRISDLSLLELFQQAFNGRGRRSAESASDISVRLWVGLPELDYFNGVHDDKPSADPVAGYLYDIARRTTVRALLTALNLDSDGITKCEIKDVEQVLSDQERIDIYNKPLGGLIAQLHQDVLFPIIPYLILSILDGRPKAHFVVTLVRSSSFSTDVTLPEGMGSGSRVRRAKVLDSLVLLGTMQADGMDEPSLHRRVDRLEIAFRPIAEAIADIRFYGGYVRAEVAKLATQRQRSSIGHELQYLHDAYTGGNGGNWTVPFPVAMNIAGAKAEMISPEVRRDSDHWTVALVPEFNRAASKKILLWMGSGKVWLIEAEMPDGPMPAEVFFARLVRIFVSSEVAQLYATKSGLASLDEVRNLKLRFVEACDEYAQKFISKLSVKRKWRVRIDRDSDGHLPQVIVLAKMIGACIGNILKGSERQNIECIDFELVVRRVGGVEKKEIRFEVMNAMPDRFVEPPANKLIGTKSVLCELLEEAGGDPATVLHEIAPAHARPGQFSWRTGFAFPAAFAEDGT